MPDLVPAPSPQSGYRSEERGTAIRPGSWWRLKREWTGMAPGTILLLSGTEVADGAVHSVRLAKPPSYIPDEQLEQGRRGGSEWKMLAAEFVPLFDPVPEAEAIASRDQEIAAVQGRIADFQSETADAQTELARISAAPMPAAGALAPPVQGTFPDTVSQGDGRGAAVTAARAAALQQDVADRARAITAATARLETAARQMHRTSARLSLYFEERAAASLAAVQPALAFASRLQEHVDTMGRVGAARGEAGTSPAPPLHG